MSIAFKSQLALRQVNKLGEPATLVEFTEGAVDEHGDIAYSSTSRDVVVVPSTATNTRLPFVRRGELGNYYTMQMEFFMSDVYETPNTAVEMPPVLVHDGSEYEITESESAKNNLVRLMGYRKRV